MTSRDFCFPGRSAVLASNAMCATSHPLASEAAIGVLRRGGNAVDAAVTAAAVLGVVEPAMTGIGGDCFAIIAKPGKPLIGLNGSGRAPQGLTAAMLRAQGFKQMPEESPHAVTIPCAIDAWAKLLDGHGTISLADALAPAIKLAEDGAPVHQRVAQDWADNTDRLNRDPGAKALYTRNGEPYRFGDMHRLPRLAKTMRAIAANGRDEFYQGPTAESMVNHLRSLGGTHTLDDFASASADWVNPVVQPYRGTEVAQLPPNTHGIIVQLILNILQEFDIAQLDPLSPERFHLELEAARNAYHYRDALIADADHMRVSVADILSKRVAQKLAGEIDPKKRARDLSPVAIPPGSDTIYLTVVDQNRMAVSFINSIYHAFGTRIADPASGVLYHSRGACFVLEEGHPNCVAPGKRPLHTIIPGMVVAKDRPTLSFGVMGGAYQPTGQAHVLSNIFDFGMDVQSAIDFPRVFWEDGRIGCEPTVPEATRKGLASMGHDVYAVTRPWGGGQAIAIDWERGTLTGGSDPRKDGLALGF